MLTDPVVWDRLHTTALIVILTVTVQMVVGFLLALLFAQAVSAARYLLILVLTPMMLSFVAVGAFFRYYYEPTFGLLSQVVRLFTGEPFILHADAGRRHGRHRLRRRLDVVALRHAAGAGRPVSVPKYLYEAAAIDRVVVAGGSSGPSPSPTSAAC